MLEVLKRLGIRADMTAGHSYGEFVALYAAGVMTLEELLDRFRSSRPLHDRGGGRRRSWNDGGGTCRSRRRSRAPSRERPRFGSPTTTRQHRRCCPEPKPVSPLPRRVLSAAGLACQPLQVGAAFHSPIVAPAADPLAALIRTLPLKPPGIAVYSNQTAKTYPTDVEGLREVLSQHLVSPVQFVAEIEAMYADGARVFLSVGPKGAQASMIRQILEGKPHRAVVCDDGDGGIGGLLQSVGALAGGRRGARSRRGCGVAAIAGCSATRWPLRRAAMRPRRICGCSTAAAHGPTEAPPLPVVTLEDAAAIQQHPAAPPKEVTQANGLRGVDSRRAPAIRRRPVREEKKIMTGDEPAGDREAALVEFQTTMQRFLEAQENIMLAYFGGERRRACARPVLQPLARTTTAPVAPRPAPGPLGGLRPQRQRGRRRAYGSDGRGRQSLPLRRRQSRRAHPRLM